MAMNAKWFQFARLTKFFFDFPLDTLVQMRRLITTSTLTLINVKQSYANVVVMVTFLTEPLGCEVMNPKH